jgi:hypothetical protein
MAPPSVNGHVNRLPKAKSRKAAPPPKGRDKLECAKAKVEQWNKLHVASAVILSAGRGPAGGNSVDASSSAESRAALKPLRLGDQTHRTPRLLLRPSSHVIASSSKRIHR